MGNVIPIIILQNLFLFSALSCLTLAPPSKKTTIPSYFPVKKVRGKPLNKQEKQFEFNELKTFFASFYSSLRLLLPVPVPPADGSEPPPDPLEELQRLVSLPYYNIDKFIAECTSELDNVFLQGTGLVPTTSKASVTSITKTLGKLQKQFDDFRSAHQQQNPTLGDPDPTIEPSSTESEKADSESEQSSDSDKYALQQQPKFIPKKLNVSKLSNSDFRNFFREVHTALLASRTNLQREIHEMAVLKPYGEVFAELKTNSKRVVWDRLQLLLVVANHGWGVALQVRSSASSMYAEHIDPALLATAQANAQAYRRSKQPNQSTTPNQSGGSKWFKPKSSASRNYNKQPNYNPNQRDAQQPQ